MKLRKYCIFSPLNQNRNGKKDAIFSNYILINTHNDKISQVQSTFDNMYKLCKEVNVNYLRLLYT